MSEIYQLKLFDLVEKIKNKEISCTEAIQSYVDRAKKSKKLNCFIEETFEQAIKKSKEQTDNVDPNKKLFGAPFAVKDLFLYKRCANNCF